MPIPPSMMFDQFLDWERQREFKHGFVDARPVAIAGGSMAHSVIQVNLIAATAPKLRGSGCRPFPSDMLARTDTGRGRDLDMTIRYGPLRGEDRRAPNSKVSGVLFEHTQRQDRTVKLADYNAPPSIAYDVLIEQGEPVVHVRSRGAHGDFTLHPEEVTGLEGMVELPAIWIVLAMDEIYEEIELHEARDGGKVDLG